MSEAKFRTGSFELAITFPHVVLVGWIKLYPKPTNDLTEPSFLAVAAGD
jgi:hypothetical protein